MSDTGVQTNTSGESPHSVPNSSKMKEDPPPATPSRGDKRKAPDKDSFNLELTNESLQINKKRPRIQDPEDSFSPSKSPVMSPLCAEDESPGFKNFSQSDKMDLSTSVEANDGSSLFNESGDNNGFKLGAGSEGVTSPNILNSTEVESTLASPITNDAGAEEQLVKASDSNLDLKSPEAEDKSNVLIADIELQHSKELSASESIPDIPHPGPQITPTDSKPQNEEDSNVISESENSLTRQKDLSKIDEKKGKRKQKDVSASSSLSSNTENSRPVEFALQIYDAKSHAIIYDTKERGRIQSDFSTMVEFLRNHTIELSTSVMSGYLADVSSQGSSSTSFFDFLNIPQQKSSRMTSLGSSIPRPSDASSISRPSIVLDSQGLEKPSKPHFRPPRKAGDKEPLLSSTRITEKSKNGTGSSVDPANKGKLEFTIESESSSRSKKTPLTNGGGEHNTPNIRSTERGRGRGRKGMSTAKTSVLTTPHNNQDSLSEPGHKSGVVAVNPLNSTKMNSNSRESEDGILMFSGVSDELDEQSVSGLTPSAQASQSRSANMSSSYSSPYSFTTSDTYPEVSRIKIEPFDIALAQRRKIKPTLGAAKGLVSKFSDPNFIKSETLWGSIQLGEPVFARWRDKSYYSGKIIRKGLNDTWYIHFEDNMEDVASETHILPVKILGVGTRGIYSPQDSYKPEEVIICGQRFLDQQNAVEKVEYAVLSDVDGRQINCLRRNLVLKEFDAKELRKQFQIPNTPIFKTADLNLDNIVSGKRRRVGAAPLTPSDQIRQLIAGAFDASSTDEQILTSTPTPKKPTDQQRRRRLSGVESDVSGDSRNGGESTPLLTTHGVEKAHTGSSKRGPKPKEKPLFHGMQFFLTASGGGDPSSSGVPEAMALTYDKDEYRETIENKGGSVISLVGREVSRGKAKIYLISDSHARTVKYIYCLAAGIPCVSSLWIGKCLEKNEIVDWKPFELSSGWSLEESAVIPAHQRKPLKDTRIYVTAESEELYNYWKPVLTAAQANLLKPLKSRKKPTIPPETNVLVTDATCSPEILEIAQSAGIPVVKPEWLVQTIITGQWAEYAGHEKYHVGIPDVSLESEEH